jgi:hypothetical protein
MGRSSQLLVDVATSAGRVDPTASVAAQSCAPDVNVLSVVFMEGIICHNSDSVETQRFLCVLTSQPPCVQGR